MPVIWRMARNSSPTPLELLAPAGNFEIGIAALSAGADAIYVGAPKFGARQNVAFSLDDIAGLVREAHLYRAKVYVALNTILYEEELPEAKSLVKALYRIGVDALIIQDMGLLELELPPIALHASTQCHNTEATQLQRLEALGFEQAVLARELTLEETATIAQQVTCLRLESFVHGALCVSYSGRCYLSAATTGRSANRGACAQLCRLPYDLLDADDNLLRKGEHLLSLKDLNRSEILEELALSGVSSFKIEGRLKSVAYVRNVVAHYRRLIDNLIARLPNRFCKASLGHIELSFTPQLSATFNRLFTDYQVWRGPVRESLINPLSPKSMGQSIGKVLALRRNEVTLALYEGTDPLHAGDGLCFVDDQRQLAGTRISKVLASDRVIVDRPTALREGMEVRRNYHHQLEKALARPEASQRFIPIVLNLEALPHALVLSAKVMATAIEVKIAEHLSLERAEKPLSFASIEAALAKWGDTSFEVAVIHIADNGLFIPRSLLGQLRRRTALALERALRLTHRRTSRLIKREHPPCDTAFLSYEYNIANSLALAHYTASGAVTVEGAFELEQRGQAHLMTMRHCLLRHLGYCLKYGRKPPFKTPLRLRAEGIRLVVLQDCEYCLNYLVADEQEGRKG